MTQRVCAGRVGMTQGDLVSLERGYYRSGPERLRRLAEVLGADADELARLAGYRP